MSKYVVKDYEGFREHMMNLIPLKCPEWTDTSQSDFGVVLVELLADALNVLSFYQDKAIAENNLETAELRESVIKLAKGMGYIPTEQIPSKYMLQVTRDPDFTGNIFLPRGYKVGTDGENEESVPFELDSDLILLSEESVKTVTITQGLTVSNEFHNILKSVPNYKQKLNYPDALRDTIRVRITTGNIQTVWTRVDNFVFSNPSDRHFMVDVDADNNSILVFGDGQSGSLIPASSSLQASYRVGGGRIGNVGLNAINTLIDPPVNGILEIKNINQLVEGEDVESIAFIKKNAPLAYFAKDSAVTLQDYTYFLRRHPKVLHGEVEETFTNVLNLYVLNKSLQVPTPEEDLEAIASYMDSKRMGNLVLDYKQINVMLMKLRAEVSLQTNVDSELVKANLTSYLLSKYHAKNSQVGSPWEYWEMIYDIRSNFPELKSVSLKFKNTDDELEEWKDLSGFDTGVYTVAQFEVQHVLSVEVLDNLV